MNQRNLLALVTLVAAFIFLQIFFYFNHRSPEESKFLLLSTPRSSSSAFYRYMQNRGDFQVLMEPLTYWKYQNPKKANHEEELLKVLKKEFHENSSGPVFLKEMAYQIPLVPALFKAIPVGTKVLFLIREPEQAIMSYFKEFLKEGYDTEFTKPEFTMNYEHFERALDFFAEESSLSLKLLDISSLLKDPAKSMKEICTWAGLSFQKKHLSWQALPDLFSQDQHWYGELRKSTGFNLPKKRHKLEDFDKKLHKRILDLTKKNQTVYERILKKHKALLLKA